MDKVIESKMLNKNYGKQKVLKKLNLNVNCGDIYGLLGPNGAGKTTFIKILLGLLAFDGGEVLVLGQKPDREGKKLRTQMNALPEDFGVYPWMNAVEYLEFFAGLYDISKTRDELKDTLKQVGIEKKDFYKNLGAYSQGMKKRIGIARALLNHPKILLLDEPSNGLDPRGKKEIHELFLRLNRETDVTIVLSTHILDDVQNLCNRIGILHKGYLQYQGEINTENSFGKDVLFRYRFHFRNANKYLSTLADLKNVKLLREENDWVICEWFETPPEKLIKSLLDKGFPVIEARNENTNLENIYLRFTGGRTGTKGV